MAYSKNRRLAEIVSDTSGNLSVEGLIVPTQSNSDNDTSAASTAFVHAHIDAVLDSAPGTLNTLNEIAAALNDDANFNTTVTNAIAAKLPLAGGTLTGALTTNGVINAGTSVNFAINTPQSMRLNIDSDDNATDQSFIVGNNQTGVNQNNVLFKVQENGRVGISISAPDAPLHVFGAESGEGASVGQLRVQSSTAFGSSPKAGIAFTNQHTSGSQAIMGGIYVGKDTTADGNYAGHMAFSTRAHGAVSVERMRITSAGTVLVGKIAEGSATDGIELNRQDVLVVTRNGDSPLILNRRSDDGSITLFRRDNTTRGSINIHSSTLQIGTGNTQFAFSDADDAFFVKNEAGTARNASHDLGKSNAKFKDLHLSGTVNAGAVTLASGGVISQTVVSGGGVYHTINHTGNEAWSWAAQSGSGSDDYLDVGISGGRRVMSWHEDGKVGIGTTSPADLLEVFDSTNPTIALGYNGGANNGGTIDWNLNVVSAPLTAQIAAKDDGNYRMNMLFSTKTAASGGSGMTERMRIASIGDIHFKCGGSQPSASVVGWEYHDTASNYPWVKQSVGGSGNLTHYQFYNTNGAVGQIYTGGSSTTYSTSSDYRLKENVDYTWDATTLLKQLKPCKFNFIKEQDGEKPILQGFLAHEVSDIVPGAVRYTKDAVDSEGEPEYQALDHSKLVPLLVKTIQELEARIATLEG